MPRGVERPSGGQCVKGKMWVGVSLGVFVCGQGRDEGEEQRGKEECVCGLREKERK